MYAIYPCMRNMRSHTIWYYMFLGGTAAPTLEECTKFSGEAVLPWRSWALEQTHKEPPGMFSSLALVAVWANVISISTTKRQYLGIPTMWAMTTKCFISNYQPCRRPYTFNYVFFSFEQQRTSYMYIYETEHVLSVFQGCRSWKV
jgi:hypothetical protein